MKSIHQPINYERPSRQLEQKQIRNLDGINLRHGAHASQLDDNGIGTGVAPLTN